MVISHKYKYIFLHSPKTGGTSVSSILFTYYDGKRELRHYGSKRCNRHVGKDVWNAYYKFAIVRNPFSRCVSWYNYLLEQVEQSERVIHPGTFENFIKNYTNIFTNKRLRSFSFTESQYDWMELHDKIDLDFVCRTETLQEDFNRVCDDLRFKRHELPHHKKTKDVDYRDYYTDELRVIVTERFQKDLDYFGYEF